ncbi:blue light receptor, partial [Gonapodya sp. JEL0774]
MTAYSPNSIYGQSMLPSSQLDMELDFSLFAEQPSPLGTGLAAFLAPPPVRHLSGWERRWDLDARADSARGLEGAAPTKQSYFPSMPFDTQQLGSASSASALPNTTQSNQLPSDTDIDSLLNMPASLFADTNFGRSDFRSSLDFDLGLALDSPTPATAALAHLERKRKREAELHNPYATKRPSPFTKGQLLSGVYSTSGFDTLGVLTRVYARKNPKIQLGPIDCDTSFVVVDAKLPDYPIVHVSENFTKLTGYALSEVLGRNCRFLQAPDGRVEKGSIRLHCDNSVIFELRKSIHRHEECQFTQLNYKKDGTPFVNLITIIPLCWNDDDDITYFVGFQVDLEEQSRRILGRMAGGTYGYGPSPSNLSNSLGPVVQSPAIGARLLPPGLDVFSRSVTPGSAVPTVEVDGRDVTAALFPDMKKFFPIGIHDQQVQEEHVQVHEIDADERAVSPMQVTSPVLPLAQPASRAPTASMASVRAAKHVQDRMEHLHQQQQPVKPL